jgi:hypothetical protein
MFPVALGFNSRPFHLVIQHTRALLPAVLEI